MSMSPTEMERKVRQLDNDVQWIYTSLSAIQGTQARHTNRFTELAERLDAIDARGNALDGRFDALDGKVGALDGKVDALGDQLGTVLVMLRGVPGNDSQDLPLRA